MILTSIRFTLTITTGCVGFLRNNQRQGPRKGTWHFQEDFETRLQLLLTTGENHCFLTDLNFDWKLQSNVLRIKLSTDYCRISTYSSSGFLTPPHKTFSSFPLRLRRLNHSNFITLMEIVESSCNWTSALVNPFSWHGLVSSEYLSSVSNIEILHAEKH